MQQKIGLVIPCFNEEKRLNLPLIKEVLHKNSPGLKLLFVNDGSYDQTKEMLEQVCQDYHCETAECISLAQNRGKAEALRVGLQHLLQHDSLDAIGYWDADLATPLDALTSMASIMEDRKMILSVIGSRVKLCGRNIIRNPIRHYLGRIFVTILNVLLSIPIYDTQCGAKLFRPHVLVGNLDRAFCSRWLFDVELLLRIRDQQVQDFCVWLYEYPLDEWVEVSGSKVTWKCFPKAIVDLITIFIQYKLNGQQSYRK